MSKFGRLCVCNVDYRCAVNRTQHEARNWGAAQSASAKGVAAFTLECVATGLRNDVDRRAGETTEFRSVRLRGNLNLAHECDARRHASGAIDHTVCEDSVDEKPVLRAA